MYAIVETCGKQYRIAAGETIEVDRLSAEVGETVTLERVLLVGGDDVKVGSPTVAGVTVTARVTEHTLGEKRITFKYRTRKRTRRRVGYRPRHTVLEILAINA